MAHVALILGAALLCGAVAPAAAQTADGALVKYEIVDNAIAQSLTGKAGDAKKGEAVIAGRTLGNCLACHAVKPMEAKEPFHGNVGPPLDGVAERLKEGEIRLRLVDAAKANEMTAMPSFYRVEGLNRVLKRFQGKPVLTAEQIEDTVAYLITLK